MSAVGAVGTVIPSLVEEVREQLATDPGSLTPDRVARALRAAGHLHGDATVLEVHDVLAREVLGAGPLEPLLRLDGVTDVLVNGASRCTSTGAGGSSAPTSCSPTTGRCGGSRNGSRPAPDVGWTTPRRTSTCGWSTAPGSTRCSRRWRARARCCRSGCRGDGCSPSTSWSPAALDESAAALVADVVDRRLAFLVSGGTGCGKTTLLSALLSRVPPDERVVVVEDSAELQPAHPHVVALEARPPNVEGAGAVTVRDLVRQALRMRPDRLVVGEVRGTEVVDLLAALNTGHEGGCGTVHANSAADVPGRLEGLAVAAGLSRDAAHSQMSSALDVVLHLSRDRDGRRRLREVAVLERGTDGLVHSLSALTRVPGAGPGAGAYREGPGAERLATLLAERDR